MYSKDGWADCAHRPDDGISNDDGVSDLFIEDFICEYGPETRVFGHDSPLTRELSLSRAIGHLRDDFYAAGGYGLDGGPSSMGFGGFFEAKIYDSIFSRKPVAITDFLGGFDSWHVTRDFFMGQSTVRFEIRNETTLASGTRYPVAREGIPLSVEEYIQDPSRYNINGMKDTVAFLIDHTYTLNTVLSKKPASLRNPFTKTGLGGGTITQIFVWEEKYQPCYKQNPLDPGLPLYIFPAL